MKTLLAILTFSIISVFTNQSAFADFLPAWVRGYNGSGNTNDYGRTLRTDNAGNVYVSGNSSGSNQDVSLFIIKYNSQGTQQWIKTYVDAVENSVFMKDMFIDNSGNVYVCGKEHGEAIILKYSSAGTLLWKKNYINGGDDSECNSVFVTSEGNVFITGHKDLGNSGYCFTVKYNSAGVLQWSDERSIDNIGNGMKIKVDGNGNVIVYAFFDGPTFYIMPFIVKYNNAGQIQGIFEINDTGLAGLVRAGDMEIDANNNIYVTFSGIFDVSTIDILTVKFNSNMVSQWKKRFNGTGNGEDTPYDMHIDNSGLVYVTGETLSEVTTKRDFITIKYLSTGTEQWRRTYDSSNDTDYAVSIGVDEIGYIYVAGCSKNGQSGFDITTLKYNTLGILIWETQYSASLKDYLSGFSLDNNGNLYVAGQSLRFLNTDSDMLLLKYASTVGIQQISGEIPSEFELKQNYPNPFNPVTNINFSIPASGIVKLEVFDITGKKATELVNSELSAGTYKFDFDASGLSSGMYFYRITVAGFSETKKMMLVK